MVAGLGLGVGLGGLEMGRGCPGGAGCYVWTRPVLASRLETGCTLRPVL